MKTENAGEARPKVYIVDDDAAMRRSTSMLLEAAGFSPAPFESGQAFLDEFRATDPGAILLDLQMPGMSGLDVIEKLNGMGVNTPIVAVTGTGTIPIAVKAMKLGLLDFLEKPADPKQLVTKVQHAIEVDAQRRAANVEKAEVRKRFADLTDREIQVLDMLVRGLASKQIATELGISVKTVENHRTHIMEKTQASNVAELVRLCMQDRRPKQG